MKNTLQLLFMHLSGANEFCYILNVGRLICLSVLSLQPKFLPHWGQEKLDTILQMTRSVAFSWIEMYEFQ